MTLYVATRQLATRRRAYEIGDLVDTTSLDRDERDEAIDQGQIVPARFVDTAANLAARNPIPGPGVVCYETDTDVVKIGTDGATAYNSLSQLGSGTYAQVDAVDARDYTTDGSTITPTALTAAVEDANGRPVYIHGAVTFTSQWNYSGTKAVNLFGLRGQTVITNTAETTPIIISGVSASAVTIKNLALVGAGTSSSGTGVVIRAIRIEGRTGPVHLSHIDASGFVNGEGIKVQGGADVRVLDCTVHDGYDTLVTKASYGGIHISGVTDKVKILGNTITGPSVNPWTIGIFLTSNTSAGTVITDAQISDNHVSGLSRHGIGVALENPTTAYSTGTAIVSGNIVRNCVEQGIKIKAVKRVHVTDNFITNCNTIPELAGELDGGINVQSSSESLVSHNTVIGDGTSGIRWDCKQIGGVSGEDGVEGRANHVIVGNVIKNPTTYGIRVGIAASDIAVIGNSITGSGNNGLLVYPGAAPAAADRPRRVTLSGNIIRNAGSQGISVNYTDDCVIQGNVVTMASSYGIVVDNGAGFTITGNHVTDSGQVSGTYGIRVGSTATKVLITANYSSNRQTSSQTYGVSLGAVATMGTNYLDGNATGRVNPSSNVQLQFGNSTSQTKGAVTGSRAGNAALASLLTRLAALDLITDSSSA